MGAAAQSSQSTRDLVLTYTSGCRGLANSFDNFKVKEKYFSEYKKLVFKASKWSDWQILSPQDLSYKQLILCL